MTLSQSLYSQLAQQNLISPYFELAMLGDDWPDEFRVPIRKHDSVTDDWFHPSSAALTPARLLYYKMHPEHRKTIQKRPETIASTFSPLLGTVFHEIIENKMVASGILKPENVEIAVIDKEIHGRGHLDFVFPNHPALNEDVVVDIKTAAPANFERMYYPYKNYVAQLNLYISWYGKMTNQDINTGVIFVVEMGRPFRTKEFRIEKDQALIDSIYKRWNYVRQCLALNTPPEEKCCEWDSKEMKECPVQQTCRETYREKQ